MASHALISSFRTNSFCDHEVLRNRVLPMELQAPATFSFRRDQPRQIQCALGVPARGVPRANIATFPAAGVFSTFIRSSSRHSEFSFLFSPISHSTRPLVGTGTGCNSRSWPDLDFLVILYSAAGSSCGLHVKKELVSFRSVPKIDIPDPCVEKKLREDAEEAFWDYQFLYRTQRSEVEVPILLTLVEGAVPDDLAGVYYLCGPGILSDDHGSQVHPLDGHGYLRKFVFNGATDPVMYSARYLLALLKHNPISAH